MNMLASLKALLFSSTATGSPASSPPPAANGADFAAMLSGSIAQAAPTGDSSVALEPSVESPVAVEAGVADVPAAEIAPLAQSAGGAMDGARHGLAVAVAAGKMPGVPLSMPPGLALGLARRAAALAPTEPVDPASADQAQVGEAVAPVDQSTPEETPEAVTAEPAKLPKHVRPSQPTEMPVRPESVMDAADPGQSASDQQDEPRPDKPEHPSLIAAPIVPLATIPPAVANVVAPPAQGQTVVASPRNKPSAAPAEGVLAPAIASSSEPSDSDAVPPTAGEATQPGPAPHGKPMKSEALALLQLVREQVSSRHSGAAIRVGDAVSAVASKRGPGRDASAEPSVGSPSPATAPDLSQLAPPASAPASVPSGTAPAAPTVDLSASLGAQMVDMGVSGQWIDGLARDIAGLSTNGAQGRFQINADQLGPVQVDIRQGAEGAAVHLTVASEAAEMALRQDSDRLKLDAGLSAVRIAEVKIDRAPHVTEASRPDTAGQQSSQQQSSQQGSAAWANNSQNMGQSQGQQGRWRAGENNGFTPKSSSDPAVLNHAQERQDAGESRRARYA